MALKNAFGDLGLDATLQELAIALESLANSLSLAKDPVTGRVRVVQDGAVGTSQNLNSVTTVNTVSDTTRLNYHSSITSTNYPAAVPAQMPALYQLQAPADALRTRIVVS